MAYFSVTRTKFLFFSILIVIFTGSVGAWLKQSACPAEIKNFQSFVACLERFERDSGMKINLKEDGGFTVPMGPDLRASISFYMP